MRLSHAVLGCVVLSLLALTANAQTHEGYRDLITPQVLSDKLPPPQHMRDYVVDGKLRLGLRDAILLTLENNSSVRVQESSVEASKFDLLRAYQPFDPQLQGSLNISRYSSQGESQLQGVGISGNSTFDQLNHVGDIKYIQTFQTGTSVSVDFNATRSSSNNQFFFFNPYYSSGLNFQFSQPLLRNRGLFVNRAPLVIARRTLQQSRATFEAQVSDAILQTVNRYWAVIQAQGSIEVRRKSLESADATYQHDKRALELGALPPLDIYRSESDVATRRVELIQSEYVLKQAEDELRMVIGANQDPFFRALDLELTEKPQPEGELQHTDAAAALQQALTHRPELDAVRYALVNDDTSIRVAHNHLKPDLSVSGFYQSSGLGGNQYDLVFDQTTGQVTSSTLVSRGGLGSSFGQLFGFSFPGYGGSLTLNLPVKNRGAQAEMGSALVSRHRDQYAAQLTREQITLEVTNAVHLLEEANLTVAAGKIAVDFAQKEVAAEQRKYELGEKTISFLLDGQNRLAQAELELLQAEVQYQIARAAVDHATGGLLEPYHVQIADLMH